MHQLRRKNLCSRSAPTQNVCRDTQNLCFSAAEMSVNEQNFRSNRGECLLQRGRPFNVNHHCHAEPTKAAIVRYSISQSWYIHMALREKCSSRQGLWIAHARPSVATLAKALLLRRPGCCMQQPGWSGATLGSACCKSLRKCKGYF